MRKNPIKRKLKRGETSMGVWMDLDHPGVAEILADAGFDWIVFDTEHSHFTTTTLRGAMDALRRTEVSPLVRVPANDPVIIKQTLDLGPEGLVIPMVCSGEQARAAVAACKYPPAGIRGIGAGRATGYGAEFETYLAEANDNILIVIQIEHVDALETLDEIVSVSGIDCLFIGPMDLSASMGITGQWDHPKLQAAISRVLGAGKRSGIPVGMGCKDEAHAVEMAAAGVQFIFCGSDTSLLARAARESLNRMRSRPRHDANSSPREVLLRDESTARPQCSQNQEM